MDLRQYQRLTDAVEAARRAEAKAEGEAGLLKKQLADEFGRDAGPKLLAKMTKEADRLEREADAALADFWKEHEKWLT